MTDPTLAALRSAGKSNQKFLRIVDELRAKSSITSYPQLISKVRRVRPGGDNGLLPPRTSQISRKASPSNLQPLPLLKEIAWVSVQLSEHLRIVERHVNISKELSRHIQNADFEDALNVIDMHMQELGESIWGIEARIGVLSFMDSQERLENYRQSRFVRYGSVPDFLVHVFEDLFDEDTSLSGFQRRMSSRLKPLRPGGLRNYLEARTGVGEITDASLSSFLRISAWYSIVDAYESLITVLPKYYLIEPNQSTYASVRAIIKKIESISDARIQTISSVFRVVSADDLRLSGEQVRINEIEPIHPDFDKIAILALNSREKNNGKNIYSNDCAPVEKLFLEALSQFKEKRSELISTYEQLHTLISKFRFLPWFDFAQTWVDGLFLAISGQLPFTLYCASTRINSGSYSNLSSLVSALPWAKVYGTDNKEGLTYIENNESLITGRNIFEATNCPISNLPYNYAIGLTRIAIAQSRNETQKMLELCVQIAINIRGSSNFLPFHQIFEGRTAWDDYEEFHILDSVIGLYFISLGDRESRNRFLLEFACKKLLGAYEGDCAKRLLEKYTSSDSRIIFILREILLPKNLRLISQLKTVEQLERFRIEICSALLDVDKDFSDQYVAETFEILQLQEMRKAERDVESSRINVDREGIKRWAEKTYREEFLHAKKARTIKVAPTLEEIEANFREKVFGDYGQSEVNLTASLKDPIFNIGYSVFQKCFWKEDDGLDHFLSLRIRHGSFAGYLRAPLEQAKLVGSGTSSGDLRSTYWGNVLQNSTIEAIENYLAALNGFQTEFDAIIEHFRNDLLQINTINKPQGLFIPGLNNVLWDAYHHDWEAAKNFDAFFDKVWDAFQFSLEASLSDVLSAIDRKILSNCEILLVALRRSVTVSGLADTDRASVISAINEGGRALQDAARSVKKWFEVTKDPVSDTRLNARQILELATKLFKKIRPNFVIEFSPFTVPQNVSFARSNISALTDALFIIFDNVYKHSGFDASAKVDLEFSWVSNSSTSGRVFISASSDIKKDRDVADIERRLNEVRTMMQSAEHRTALVSEGRSGLIKLAWITSNTGRSGTIDFSLTSDYRFNVEISMEFSFTASDKGLL